MYTHTHTYERKYDGTCIKCMSKHNVFRVTHENPFLTLFPLGEKKKKKKNMERGFYGVTTCYVGGYRPSWN